MKYLSLFLFVFLPSLALAHPGGTDSRGGHHCWTDCEQWGLRIGEYHFHDDNDASISTYEKNEELFDKQFAQTLHGRILLQVQANGEAWYIRSNDSMRYYMKDGETAYQMMRLFSLGITDENLAKIPAIANTNEMKETESICSSNELANQLRGEILLQVEQNGEAWYIDPEKCLRIYLKDGEAAYEVMRFLGLGITNTDLEKIPEATID